MREPDRRTDRVRCYVCEAESEQQVALRATEDGAADLDTRPAESMRSTMPLWVQRCPACGYCAPDLASGSPRAARVVRTAGYRALLDAPTRPALASAFLAASAVMAAAGAFADAGWQCVYAAWACDDAGDDFAAGECRGHALELFAQAASVRQPIAEEPGADDAVCADLLRRTGRFDAAAERAAQGLARAPAPAVQRVMRYIMALAAQGDRGAHSIAEAPEGPAAPS
jgi:hypothetical protein